jgi:hypothetical protein
MKFPPPIRATSTPKMKETLKLTASETPFVQDMKSNILVRNRKGVDPFTDK